MRAGIIGVAVLLVFIGLPLAAAADPLSSCKSCHDLSADKRKVMGPPLFGLYGAKPINAAIPVKKWDDASLDAWLANPKDVLPGNTMMFKVADKAKRDEVIAAMKALK
ncbi:MAG: cytochrome c family protein [Deltaproteobacteria bacterium]|nr:cytochrome c family protein [Deltaproteobacteria bacterium]